MKAPLFEGIDEGVTTDLCKKIVVDVFDTIRRTLDIAPQPHAAIITAAGATVVGMLGTLLQKQTDVPINPSGKPDDPSLVVAALIIARFCINSKGDYITEAFKDADILMKARRFS